MMMKREGLLLLFFLSAFVSQALDVSIELFSKEKHNRAVITHYSGRYIVYCDDTEITTLSKNESITIIQHDTFIELIEEDSLMAKGKQVKMIGQGLSNVFSIQVSGKPIRRYDNNLLISVFNKTALQFINRVDLEKYVAGVILAEAGGSTKSPEYFMVQAIVSRTYALRHINANGEGFLLKDDVSNQVYHGKCFNSTINMAVAQTAGEVIVYHDNKLIDAVFHSNSGGHTANAEDVWLNSVPYLKAKADTFSFNQKNYYWERSFSTVEWLNYLDQQHNYPVHDKKMYHNALYYAQPARETYFYDSIPLKTIRQHFKLPSTFFNITHTDDKVIFSGRGYGHGVGLSQEGAIRMAENGYSPHAIIYHYYSDVRVTYYNTILALAE